MKLRRLASAQAAFTIIELLIVIAIAAVILVTVLVAVPHLQRNQRDSGRKDYANRLDVALHDYYTNNQSFPDPDTAGGAAQVNNFKAHYVPQGNDPSTGQPYSIVYLGSAGSHSTIPTIGQIIITKSHWCNVYGDGDKASDPIAGDDKSVSIDYALVIGTEGASYYCLDNHIR